MASPSVNPALLLQLTQWLQPGALVALFGLLITNSRSLRHDLKEDIKVGRTKLDNKIDTVKAELKEHIRATEARLDNKIDDVKTEMKEEIRVSEARLGRRIDDVKVEIRVLGDKLDRVLEGFLATKT